MISHKCCCTDRHHPHTTRSSRYKSASEEMLLGVLLFERYFGFGDGKLLGCSVRRRFVFYDVKYQLTGALLDGI